MMVEIRHGDSVRPADDVVLRAGGGDPSSLVRSALDNADAYRLLVERGLIKSAYTISASIPRAGIADVGAILCSPPYLRYRPYLVAPAALLLRFPFLEIVATTVLVDGVEPSPVDLRHFDIVVDAADEAQLFARVMEIRSVFVKLANPYRVDTV